ncbi:hypothetical protein [Streptomyces antibioticus]|uniref:hypothetical protein n=1 Tax=Streptomyces antibioticus TaxID=1890 RepID=UPI00379258D5
MHDAVDRGREDVQQCDLVCGCLAGIVAEILPGAVDDTVVLAGRCPELINGLAKERRRIDAAIDALIAARDILDSLVGHPLDPQAVAPSR